MSFLSTSLSVLVFAAGTWLIAVLLCCSVSLQRNIFYAHKAPISRGQQLNKPETFGYLRNQVQILSIRTPDGCDLFAWLVIPLRVYQHHEAELRACQSSEKARDLTLQYIASDPQARLVIYFHGNAGTVGQTRRTEAYRSISSGDCDNLYVLAFDYRGFGRSTGAPTEEALTTDALAVIDWAAKVAKLRHQHIFLVAQSLGTAVAASAVYRLGTSIELGGMMMCAPFTDAAAVILGYKILGILPLLAPVQYIPYLRIKFVARFRDRWNTAERLQSIIAQSKSLRLTIVRALNDEVIPPYVALELVNKIKAYFKSLGVDHEHEIQCGDGGSVYEAVLGSRKFRSVTLHYGGHNTIMKWAPVALEVAKMVKE